MGNGKIVSGKIVSGYTINLYRPNQQAVKWGEVKNHILTFVDMLNKNYDMKGISRVIRLFTSAGPNSNRSIPFPKGSRLDNYGELSFNNVESFLNLESKIYDNVTLNDIIITIKE
jgi:hypothetical protein